MIDLLIIILWSVFYVWLVIVVLSIFFLFVAQIKDYIHYKKLDQDPNSVINVVRRYNERVRKERLELKNE